MAKKAENVKKFVKGEDFDSKLTSLNDYWGLGVSGFNDLTYGKAVEVDEKNTCVKELIKNKLIIVK